MTDHFAVIFIDHLLQFDIAQTAEGVFDTLSRTVALVFQRAFVEDLNLKIGK